MPERLSWSLGHVGGSGRRAPLHFTGRRPPNNTARQSRPRLADVARRAGVAVGTVSAVLNARESVSDSTRVRVQAAIADLGCVRSRHTGSETAWPPGSFSRRPQGGARQRRRSSPGPCRCWLTRGRAFRCGAVTRPRGLTCAGCRLRRD
ncbi:MAG TPA: LacI family DNA-binding transcriptional regulator [Micromonosporaceae bacterium]